MANDLQLAERCSSLQQIWTCLGDGDGKDSQTYKQARQAHVHVIMTTESIAIFFSRADAVSAE